MSDIVVSTDWLAAHRDDEGVRVVDVRDAWEYDGIGHVPGAVNVPFEKFRSEAGEEEGMLPGDSVWAGLLGEAGVAADHDLVAYDDEHGVFAARFLVTALLYGHDEERLHLLDGDYSAWTREHEVSTEEAGVDPAIYEVSVALDSPLVSRDQVADAMDDPEAVIVDTREEWEYEEGHIPGAVQLDWRELVDEESRGLKPEG